MVDTSILDPGDAAYHGMIAIPAGTFLMGSDEQEAERPPHEVLVAGFLIDRFPVTIGDYFRFVADTGHKPPPEWRGGRPVQATHDHPVVDVTWFDALASAGWAGKRLPTEAEWEKAASWDEQSGTKRPYPWGDTWQRQRAQAARGVAGIFRHQGTSAVGSFSPEGDSPFGVADMAGNVWEWCSSLFLPYPYSQASEPASERAAGSRVLRGGSWGSPPEQCRTTSRLALQPGYVVDGVCGFRCAVSMSPEKETGR
jgi:formylglycine-generating enzyme required for sulfatase activity